MSVLADRLMQVLAAVLPGDGPKALHEPEFAGNEWAYTKECIDSGWVSSAGKFVEEFEARLAQYTGARSAVAVVNGTAALQIAIGLAGARRDEEVLIPALTFVATANAVAHCGALPHFLDSEPSTLGLDPAALHEHLARSRSAPAAAGATGSRDVASRRSCPCMHSATRSPCRASSRWPAATNCR